MVPRYDLTRLKTREHFIGFLGSTEALLAFSLDFKPPPDPAPEPEPDENGKIIKADIPAFFRHKIPKKNKARGFRVAWEPSLLKSEYKKFARLLGKFFEYKLVGFPHPAAHGYIGGRSIKGNAQVHCGHKHLLATDIAEFFPSIDRDRLQAFFLDCGFSDEMADLLARFVTIDGRLPLGLPTSPVLSNAIFLPVDLELQALALSLGATYSRYSDDMSFSSDGPLPEVEDIGAILARHGFALAAAKTRRSVRGQAHYVTGLSISDPAAPHAPRHMKRRLRQELYYAQKHGLNDHLLRLGVNDADVAQQQLNRLDGTVKYVSFHEPGLASRIKPQWLEILQAEGGRPSYPPRNQNSAAHCICIDEAEYASPDGPVLALGLSVSQHQGEVMTAANDVLQDALSDLWAAGDPMKLEKKGLHFADATMDLRLRYADRLKAMPFEGYVVMGRLERYEDYEATYLKLLGAVIRRRLMAAESRSALFLIEKNNKIAEYKVRGLIQDTMIALKAENNRRPIAAPVQFVAKPNLSISVPDFLLGILGLYLQTPEAPSGRPEPWNHVLFERIRDKCRLILDIDMRTEYSRRRPISPWVASPE